MSAELKMFGVMVEPQKTHNKSGDLPVYGEMIRARNKSSALVIAHANFLKAYPDLDGKYFKPKVWPDREGLPRMQLEAGFTTEFFGTIANWNPETGEPEFIQAEAEDAGGAETKPEDTMAVAQLESIERAFSLVLFGPCQEIDIEQYSQIVDMKIDDNLGPEHEQAEAISREPCMLQLHPEKQAECLAWVRSKAKKNAKWPDYKNLITKWLDTKPDKREPVTINDDQVTGTETHTLSGATLGGGNITDRGVGFVHNLATLRRDTAFGVVAISMDFDIYEPPKAISQRAKEIDEEGKDPRFTAWWKQLRRTPGILDYSLASLIALIKVAPEDIHLKPIEHREYINRHLVESDHARPAKDIVEIACGRSSQPLPQKPQKESASDETRHTVQTEAAAATTPQPADDELRRKTDELLAAQRGEHVPGISDPTDPKWVTEDLTKPASNEVEKTEVSEQANTEMEEPPCEDNHPAMSGREIEIEFALNDLLSGRTNVISQDEAVSMVSCTGHLNDHIVSLIIADITEAESFIMPEFSDAEIHDVATTLLDSWTDNSDARRKMTFDAIVDYRKLDDEPCEKDDLSTEHLVQKDESVNQHLVQKDESVNQHLVQKDESVNQTGLTYEQLLTIAATQGLCANPACISTLDDIPSMAISVAGGIVRQQGGHHG